MPVTAKLSQAFYDRLGHPVADEMVEWFNQVDAAYRTDLRELNELNFARFDAKLEQRFAESDLRMEKRFTGFSTAVETRFTTFEVALERRFAEFSRDVDRRINDLSLQLKESQVVQMRWMIGMWVVQLAAITGLLLRR